MGTLVKIVHDQVYPYRLWPCGECELVRIPAVTWEGNQWDWRVLLGFPGGMVEVSEGDVVVSCQFLDFGVDDVCFLGFRGELFEDGGSRGHIFEVDFVLFVSR